MTLRECRELLTESRIELLRCATDALRHLRWQATPGLPDIVGTILEEDFQKVCRLAQIFACFLVFGDVSPPGYAQPFEGYVEIIRTVQELCV
jgi:hypothetical protein